MNAADTADVHFFEGLKALDDRDFKSAEAHFLATLEFAPRSIPTP